MLSVGDKAPDFDLKGSADPVKLSNSAGKENVVVMFYPFSFTGVCTGELCELQTNLSAFSSSAAKLVAISCDASPTQAKFANDEGLTFPVLADFWPHGSVAKAYGVFNDDLGCATRATFVIDKAGMITAVIATDSLGEARAYAEYEKALANLS